MGIKVDDICFLYERGTAMQVNALDHVSAEIPDNQFIGLIGHTGSGKSTFVQTLNGLLKVTSGHIYYNGEDIDGDKFDKKKLRSDVGLVFQYPEHQLFEVDVITDVMFGPRNLGLSAEEAKRRSIEALESVKMPKSLYKSSPFDLSGGQKRRAAIAGVLAMRPRILILDEPTAGLDPRGRDEILGLIADMKKELNMTIILVSHSMDDVARYVDRIMVMGGGKLLYDDDPVKVFRHVKELEDLGLAAPQITQTASQSKKRRKRSWRTGRSCMFDSITLGQYYQTDSALHRLDPRVKLVGTFAYLIALFVVDSWVGYLLVALFLAAMIRLSNVPFRYIVRGMKTILFLLLITVCFNLFLTPGEVIWQFGFLKMSREGLSFAIKMALRLSLLILGSSIMTLTTTPTQLTDALESLMRPLKKIHVPVHEISMMMSIALRFIPILMEETDKIMKAQIARGADFESRNLVKKIKSLVPLLVPLFISAFRRANDLAMAMEARCYRGGEGRTKMKPLVYQGRDRVAYGVLLLYFAACIATRVIF